ncbi:hypothetical protein BLA29_010724, partial [Euroglyphus maynei]
MEKRELRSTQSRLDFQKKYLKKSTDRIKKFCSTPVNGNRRENLSKTLSNFKFVTSTPKVSHEKNLISTSNEQLEMNESEVKKIKADDHIISNSDVDDNINNSGKKPMNAYMIFLKRNRALIEREHPNLNSRGVVKILGEMWNSLSAQEQQQFYELANKMKEAHYKRLHTSESSPVEDQPKKSDKSKNLSPKNCEYKEQSNNMAMDES